MVGRMMLKVLEERNFPVDTLIPAASERSAGREVIFMGKPVKVVSVMEAVEAKPDVALFSAGAAVSREWAPVFAENGTVVIDNSSAWRMEKGIPLVVPEINSAVITSEDKIIANPNCSTIQMVVVLAALRTLAPITRVVVSTYQAASGAGQAAMDELYAQTGDFLAGRPLAPQAFAHRIAFNCIPQIDVFLDDGSTKEEWKMVVETKKIMHQPDLQVAATCVRVPVLRCHSEALAIEFDGPAPVDDARAILERSAGIAVLDDTEARSYPMPALLEGTDDCYVGRLRTDPSVRHGLQLWIVADQLRKGAALNTVQIAEALLGR